MRMKYSRKPLNLTSLTPRLFLIAEEQMTQNEAIF